MRTEAIEKHRSSKGPVLKKHLSTLGLLVVLIGCSGAPVAPDIPLEDLLNAPEFITIDGREYSLEAFLWRDFMPGQWGSEGSPLMAVVRVTATDMEPFPSDINADWLWVVNGKETWAALTEDLEPDNPNVGEHQLGKRADGGPRWETGIYVDVIIRATHEERDTYLLRAANVKIEKTE
jgi:hypothetical protein